MTWLGLAVGLGVIMVVWSLKRPSDEKASVNTQTNLTIFFNPVSGEGHLFVGGILVIYFVSRFFLEILTNMRGIFG